MNTIPPEFRTQLEEVKLRGVFLQFAVDAEFIISTIIVECFNYNKLEISSYFFDNKGKGKDLDKLSMSEKIEVCKEGLKKYYPSFYTSHRAYLEVIDRLRDFRNKFAHQKMDFDTAEPNRIFLTSLASNYRTYTTEYDLNSLWRDLEDYRKSLMHILEIILAFINNHPASDVQTSP